MRRASTLARFARGLITDQRMVKGGLLEATDVVPVHGGAAWRRRQGHKQLLLTWALDGVEQLFSYSLPSYPGGYLSQPRYGVLAFGTAGVSAVWSTFNGTQTMRSDVRTQSGALRSYPGRLNLMRSAGDSVPFESELLMPTGPGWFTQGIACRYGGADLDAQFATGTASLPAGSRTVTLAGGVWPLSVVGNYLMFDGIDQPLRIERWVSNTTVEVARTYFVSLSGAFRVQAMAPWSCRPGTFGAPNQSTIITTASTVMAGCVTQHQGRVFGGWCVGYDNVTQSDDLRWCAPRTEDDGSGWRGSSYWHPSARLPIFPGRGGDGIRALASYNGVLFIFKPQGVFALRGNVETDGRDVGAQVDTVSLDDGCDSPLKVVETPDGIVFAGSRGLYLLTDRGMRCMTDELGVSELYEQMFGTLLGSNYGYAGQLTHLSRVADTVVAHGNQAMPTAFSTRRPNTLVWHMGEGGQFSTQITMNTTRVQQRTLDGWVAGMGGGLAQWHAPITNEYYEGYPYDELVHGDCLYPVRPAITTHPFPLQGDVSGRVRAVLARIRSIGHADLPETPSDAVTDGEVKVVVLPGEQGTIGAFEVLIDGDDIAGTDITESERWVRSPTRGGSPPLETVRMQLRVDQTVDEFLLYEMGVEHVPVARLRS